MEPYWPTLVDAGTKMKAGGFGFAVNAFGSYVVPCDFDSLVQQSLLIGQIMAEGHESIILRRLERYCGDEIYPRLLAVQLVALYLSAKRKDDATSYVFVSPERFQEACIAKNKLSIHLSVSDQGAGAGVLLWSELMGIASFLQIPTLERLIRTAVVRDDGGWDYSAGTRQRRRKSRTKTRMTMKKVRKMKTMRTPKTIDDDQRFLFVDNLTAYYFI